MVGLLDLGERFRLVANEIEVVPPPEPLPKLPVACAVWRPAPEPGDVGGVLADRRWTAPHGDDHLRPVLQSLADLALMLDVELLHIGGDTTVRDFVNELRWNSAYYRLAQGL